MGEHVDRIDREIARRAGKGLPFAFVVSDRNPDAMTDVETAVRAVIANADNRATGHWDRVWITNSIHGAVVDALRAAHPRRAIVARTIQESGLRHAPMPEAAGAGVSSVAGRVDAVERDDDAIERARARISAMMDRQ